MTVAHFELEAALHRRAPERARAIITRPEWPAIRDAAQEALETLDGIEGVGPLHARYVARLRDIVVTLALREELADILVSEPGLLVSTARIFALAPGGARLARRPTDDWPAALAGASSKTLGPTLTVLAEGQGWVPADLRARLSQTVDELGVSLAQTWIALDAGPLPPIRVVGPDLLVLAASGLLTAAQFRPEPDAFLAATGRIEISLVALAHSLGAQAHVVADPFGLDPCLFTGVGDIGPLSSLLAHEAVHAASTRREIDLEAKLPAWLGQWIPTFLEDDPGLGPRVRGLGVLLGFHEDERGWSAAGLGLIAPFTHFLNEGLTELAARCFVPAGQTISHQLPGHPYRKLTRVLARLLRPTQAWQILRSADPLDAFIAHLEQTRGKAAARAGITLLLPPLEPILATAGFATLSAGLRRLPAAKPPEPRRLARRLERLTAKVQRLAKGLELDLGSPGR